MISCYFSMECNFGILVSIDFFSCFPYVSVCFHIFDLAMMTKGKLDFRFCIFVVLFAAEGLVGARRRRLGIFIQLKLDERTDNYCFAGWLS